MKFKAILAVAAAMSMLAGAAMAQTIKLAVVTKPGSAQNVVAEEFKRLVEARSRGALRVEIFDSGSQGDESQILDKVRAGQLQACVVTAGVYDRFAPEVRALEFPFLFQDYGQVDRVICGSAGKKLLALLGRHDLTGLAFAENGFRHLTNSRRPVKAVGDVAGLRIRVMNSAMHQALWRALGAEPTPHPWPIDDLLASGQVDGQENPLWVIWSYRLDKRQKHLSLTAHVYSAHICAANLKWCEGLAKKDRDLVREAMTRAAASQRKMNRERAAGFLAQLKKAGMAVVEHPDAAGFRQKLAGFEGQDLFKAPEVKALLKHFREALAR